MQIVEDRMVTKKIFYSIDAARKPYYCGIKYPLVSVVIPRRPCLALHRRVLSVHLPPAPGSISACQHDDLGVAHSNVTSNRRITPSAAYRAYGEQISPKQPEVCPVCPLD